MALEKPKGRRIFVNIKKGELTVKTKEGAVETYGSLTGMLTGIGISKQEFQGQQYDRLELSISDGLEIYELQMRFDSGYSRGFCYTIKNADLEKPIKFAPMYKEKDGKKESWLFLSQFGKPLPRYYRKDAPNGLPPMKKVTVKGKEIWDNTDQLNFWREMLMLEIKPKLVHPAIAQSDVVAEAGAEPVSDDINEPMDDLPF